MEQCGYCGALTFPTMSDGRLECPHCGAPWFASQVGKAIGEAIAEELLKPDDNQPTFALPPEDYVTDKEEEDTERVIEQVKRGFEEETRERPIEIDYGDRPSPAKSRTRCGPFRDPIIPMVLIALISIIAFFPPGPMIATTEPVRVMVVADEPVLNLFTWEYIRYDGQIWVGNETHFEYGYCSDGEFISSILWNQGVEIWVELLECEYAQETTFGPFVVYSNHRVGDEPAFAFDVRPEPPEFPWQPAEVFSTKLINKSWHNSLRGESVPNNDMLTGAVKGASPFGSAVSSWSRLITFKSDIDFATAPSYHITSSLAPSVHPSGFVPDSTRKTTSTPPPTTISANAESSFSLHALNYETPLVVLELR